jgi:hypothetical protein
MANVLQMVRDKITGADDVGDLVGEIESTRAKGIAASAELERLEQARLVAEDYDAAKVIEGRIDRVRFEVEKLAAAFPLLENRLSVSRAARNAKLLQKHQEITRKILPRLISAVENCADIQQEATDARDAAIRDLGEGAIQRAIEPITFMGVTLKPFVAIWADAMRKRLEAPAPQPAVAVIAPVPAKPAAKPTPAAPVVHVEPAKPRRPLRNDLVAIEGHRRVKFHRSNIELEDGTLSRVGDVVSVPASVAEKLIEHGGADYAQAPTAGKGN